MVYCVLISKRRITMAKTIKVCPICNKEFGSYPCEAKTYCSRSCYCKSQSAKVGPASPNWKGGRRVHKGYVLIYCPDHPRPTMRFYVKEHRLVMEKHLGRYLKPEEVVHHNNNIKTDNRIENLTLFENHSVHMKSFNHSSPIKLVSKCFIPSFS